MTTLDGTLRAIIAADRFQATSTKELLHRRLEVFYAYFTLLGALGAIANRLRQFPPEIDSHALAFLLNVQCAHVVLLGLTFVALRYRVRDGVLLYVLDVVATLATAATGAIALSAIPAVVSVDVSVVAFFVLFFVVRAAIVPSKPWVATLIAAASAVPFALGLGSMYGRASPAFVHDASAATFAACRTMIAGIAAVHLVSKTIYGLRSEVERAVRLGQYEVHEKIGEGGMGAVYRASHAMLKRPTAVKVIPPDRAGDAAAARFEREVMAASRLTHPNVIAIYDYGRTRGGVFYYAMELLEGEDLASLVEREGRQSSDRARHILHQIASALDEAHDAGLVHRDVKPANVMLCRRGGDSDFVKVLDFGLVKDITASDMKITQERAITGTPLYMAPESILSPETVGPPADVYALGCIAYFLLTARPPFEANNLVAICAAHVHSAPAPPSRHVPDVPRDLEALILRCLDKSPEARPTMHALATALETSALEA